MINCLWLEREKELFSASNSTFNALSYLKKSPKPIFIISLKFVLDLIGERGRHPCQPLPQGSVCVWHEDGGSRSGGELFRLFKIMCIRAGRWKYWLLIFLL